MTLHRIGGGYPKQAQLALPDISGYWLYNGFNNGSGTVVSSLTGYTPPAISQIKAAVISFWVRWNESGSASTNALFPMTLSSKPFTINGYSVWFYLPLANVATYNTNNTCITRTGTVGTSWGIGIKHTTTANSYNIVFSSVALTNPFLFPIPNDEWINIQAWVNFNDLANSNVRINGAKFTTGFFATATTVQSGDPTDSRPVIFSTTNTSTTTMSIAGYHAKVFDTVQGATLQAMCDEIVDFPNMVSKKPSAYSWDIAMSEDLSKNTGTAGGNYTHTLAPVQKDLPIVNAGKIQTTKNDASTSVIIKGVYSNSGSTLNNYYVNNGIDIPASDLVDNRSKFFFVYICLGYNTSGNVYTSLEINRAAGTDGIMLGYSPDIFFCGPCSTSLYTCDFYRSAIFSDTSSTANKTYYVCVVGYFDNATRTLGYCRVNKSVNIARSTTSVSSLVSRGMAIKIGQNYVGTGNIAGIYVWNAANINAHPGITWTNGAAMENMFYDAGTNMPVSRPDLALGVTPKYAVDPGRGIGVGGNVFFTDGGFRDYDLTSTYVPVLANFIQIRKPRIVAGVSVPI